MFIKAIAQLIIIAVSLGAGGYFVNKYYPKGTQSSEPPVVVVKPLDEPVVMSTNGGLLGVSRVIATEEFSQTTNHEIFTIPIPGPTIAKIQVQATYHYHVELAPKWKFIRRDKTFVVIAPPVKPTLPIAIDTGTLKAQANGTWSFMTGNGQISALQKPITATLAEKAKSPYYLLLQKEHARATVKQFVQKWVLSQDKWKDGDYSVRVFFADEPIDQLQANGYHPVPIN